MKSEALLQYTGAWKIQRAIERYKKDRGGMLVGLLDHMNTEHLYPPAVDYTSREVNRMAYARDIARQCGMLDRMRVVREKAQGGDEAALRRLLDLSGRPWERQTFKEFAESHKTTALKGA